MSTLSISCISKIFLDVYFEMWQKCIHPDETKTFLKKIYFHLKKTSLEGKKN